ncbi:MAG: mannose-1-phosphate guanylyltransferase/mannose-6-phosphate isomerase [Xanthobacteraceae bacterium]|nr:MAG: mannose-1-phosphate guanylyltransferase/mannose-6-phosphate isomerase [Xanthobacteraceae bacterium]
MGEKIIPLIMCGGAGTRLWPASRENRPKQFLRLFGPHSMFQQAVLRVADARLFGRPIVITNAAYRFVVLEQLAEIGCAADILLEPVRRDSGPAIVAGAAFAAARAEQAVVLAMAADHHVTDPAAFAAACRQARAAAVAGKIVTFGVRPDRPATEYGYILPAAQATDGVFAVARFVEKPDLATAERYVAAGYLWNSGNFMFRADVLCDEYRRVDPSSVAAVTEAVARAAPDLEFLALDGEAFSRAKAISIDYAVMEKTTRAAVVPVSCGWSDVGNWRAVWDLADKDAAGNAAFGEAVFHDANNCVAMSDKALVALYAVDDLVVSATQDAILVARRGAVDGMKPLIEHLRIRAPHVTQGHLVEHRPWGSYQLLDHGQSHQVKRITVKPGGRLSLQKHAHRSEHWIVVHGIAQVTLGEVTRTVHENESVYIPMGTVHRLHNLEPTPLELIEVQTGGYLGEDDIVRLEDDYRRS